MNKKKIISYIFFTIALVLILYCYIVLRLDYLNNYIFGSAPFYAYILVRSIEFILPAILCIVIGIVLIKKSKK